MMRYGFLIATFLSLVWLPWPITLALMIVSSVSFPLSGIVFGVLFDMIYAPVGALGIPLGVLWGGVASLLGYVLSRFMQERIMSA
jgi:hypothetical protein